MNIVMCCHFPPWVVVTRRNLRKSQLYARLTHVLVHINYLVSWGVFTIENVFYGLCYNVEKGIMR